MGRGINYESRNFADYRTDLINYVKQYYPDIFNDFNDSSIATALIELNAAIGDNLSHLADKNFNEIFIDYAKEKKSVLAMARTMGLKIPGKRPSITIADFSVTVPVLGDTFDLTYAPLIRRGAQVTGAGKAFETTDDIDFASPFTTGGLPNRLIIPNVDNNGTIINYTLTKREIVINGITKIFKRVIKEQDAKPFFEIILPENDVLSVTSIIALNGTSFTRTPTINEFSDPNNRWYEMEALADDKIFVSDDNAISDNASILPGKYIRVDKKFITEYTDLGFTKIIFGGGSQDVTSLCDFGVSKPLVTRIGDFINNMSLGETLTPNTTLFIQYRTGGGSASNIGPNVLKTISSGDIFVNGSNPTINTSVRASLKVNNPIAALGGRNEPSVDEIKAMIKYNFSAQNRAVTLKDYLVMIAKMPGEFGVPFRVGVSEVNNKVNISILGLDSSGKLTNESTNTLQSNIANYLADVRMINDYVEVTDGKIINLGFEVDLLIEKQFPQSQIITQVANTISDYMDINKWQMGENIYLGQLIEAVNNVGGVLNVIDIRVYNKVGGTYSLNETSQPYIDEETRQIDLLGEATLFGEPNAMYEIKDKTRDTKIRVK